jgi:hypothetical protein
MVKIRRDLKRVPIPNKTVGATQIATACTGNPNATGLSAELAALASANTALGGAYNAAQLAQHEAERLTAVQNAAELAWEEAFDALIDAAQASTKGDADKILSLGLTPFEPGRAPAVGPMPTVANLNATTGDFAGTVDLTWDKVPGARTYNIQLTTTPNDDASFKLVSASVRSSYTVTGLTSGTKYWFRVAAVGTAGPGPWSDPAEKMAA